MIGKDWDIFEWSKEVEWVVITLAFYTSSRQTVAFISGKLKKGYIIFSKNHFIHAYTLRTKRLTMFSYVIVCKNKNRLDVLKFIQHTRYTTCKMSTVVCYICCSILRCKDGLFFSYFLSLSKSNYAYASKWFIAHNALRPNILFFKNETNW